MDATAQNSESSVQLSLIKCKRLKANTNQNKNT